MVSWNVSSWSATTASSTLPPSLAIGERQDVEHRPDRRDLALAQDHHGGREPRHLGDGVADVEDRHADLVAQPLDVGQDLGPPLLVERGERLVHQQQPRMGEQRAADRDPLLLAARQRVRPALDAARPMPSSSTIEPKSPATPPVAAREPAAVEQVLAHAEMREQAAVLEDVADAAAMRAARTCRARCRPASRRRPTMRAALRPDQAGDDVDQARLARARAAEQRRHAGLRR